MPTYLPRTQYQRFQADNLGAELRGVYDDERETALAAQSRPYTPAPSTAELPSADPVAPYLALYDQAVSEAAPASFEGAPRQVRSAVPTTTEISGGGRSDASSDILSRLSGHASRFGDEARKALAAVLTTEGGMTGVVGDLDRSTIGSHGPLQFYGSGGQLNTFANAHGLSLQQAAAKVKQDPDYAVQWALDPNLPGGGYLGNALQRGLQAGLSGPDLATYLQRTGQVSESPERAGANYQALFGGGQNPLSTAASIASGTVGTVASTARSAARDLMGVYTDAVTAASGKKDEVGASLMQIYATALEDARNAEPLPPTTNLYKQQDQFVADVKSGAIQGTDPSESLTNLAVSLGVPSHETLGFKAGPLEVGPAEVLGFAASMAVDPLNYLPGGQVTKAGKAAKLGAEAVEAGAEVVGKRTLDDVFAMFNRTRGAQSPLSPESVPAKLNELPGWLERQGADRFADVNRLAGPAAEEAVALFQGRAGAAQLRVTEALAPVYETLGSDTLVDPLNAYVKLQRDREVALAKGGARKASAGGIGAAQADAGLAYLERQVGPQAWTLIQQADQLRQRALDTLLDDKVAVGLVDPGVAARLKAAYPHYNPTTVLKYLDEGASFARGTGRVLNQQWNTMRRLAEEGASSDTEKPLLSAARAIVEGDIAIRRNQAVQSIIEGLVSRGLATKINPVRLKTGPRIGAPPGTMTTIATRIVGDVPGTLSFFENGKQVFYTVPPEVEKAAKNLDPISLGVLGKIGRVLNAPLRAGATTLSPAFLLTNAIADFITTFVREGAGTAARIPKGYLSAARRDDTSRAFIRAGGSMESYFQRDPANVEKLIQETGGILVKGPVSWRTLLKAGKDLATLQPIRRVGEIVEAGPRLATFERHLARGESPTRAALAGRRVTVDFGRGGQAVQAANSWVLFLNARVQGTLNMGRTLRDNPASRWRLAGLSALAASTYAWNRQFPEYADVPDYLKDTHAIILLPGSEKAPSGPGYEKLHFIAIPLREWSVFASPLRKLFDQQDDRTWGEFSASLLRSVTPISGESAAAGVASAIPAPLRTPLEAQVNQRFFSGLPIVSRKYEGLPPSEQYDARTSELSKRLATSDLPLVGNRSPKGLDFVIAENLGGLGHALTGAADTVLGKPAEGTPVLSGLTRGILREYGGQLEERQFQQMGKIIDAEQERLAEKVRALPEYQKATPDRQVDMMRYVRNALIERAKEELGIESRERDSGAPQKYRGVSDTAREKEIDDAIRAVNAYERDRRNTPRPTRVQERLADRYEEGQTPSYQRFQRQTMDTNANLRKLAEEAVRPR